jgi:hypothetical protein
MLRIALLNILHLSCFFALKLLTTRDSISRTLLFAVPSTHISRPLVFGVGFNDALYPTMQKKKFEVSDEVSSESLLGRTVAQKGIWKVTWICPYYARWVAMLKLCYSPKVHANVPSYLNCSVCEEWKTFSVFRQWY